MVDELRERASDVVVRLTPPGRGAIAVVLVRGRGAKQAIQRFFRRGMRRAERGKRQHSASLVPELELGNEAKPSNRGSCTNLRFGHWVGDRPGACSEEVVLRRRADAAIEICCHGGRAAVERVVGDLVRCGFRRLESDAWLAAEATRGGSGDRIRSEAVAALARASTQHTAAILLDQYHGALRRAIERAAEFGVRGSGFGVQAAGRLLARLLARVGVGRRLTQPATLALLGRPNVGKSSLMNAIAGYTRAIVDDRPGTTRDATTLATAIDGWPVQVVDTAGLRGRPASDLEAAGIERAAASIERADLRLLVLDRSRPLTQEDHRLLERWPDAIRVANKADLSPAGWHAAAGEQPELGRSAMAVSALQGIGLEALLAAISGRLVGHVPPPGAAVPFTERQVELLAAARSALARGNREATQKRLEDVVGH